ncbi:MAG: DUF3791 domain-containing protein [Hungatella hathewayi]|nr:DUF3791 domain-containing protein [Hungatella hathewayi]
MAKKYSRIIDKFARTVGINGREALDFFYHSITYQDMSEGVSDMHCRSDEYLVQELQEEFGKVSQRENLV